MPPKKTDTKAPAKEAKKPATTKPEATKKPASDKKEGSKPAAEKAAKKGSK